MINLLNDDKKEDIHFLKKDSKFLIFYPKIIINPFKDEAQTALFNP